MKKVLLVIGLLVFSTAAYAAIPVKLTVIRDPRPNNLNKIQVYNAATGALVNQCANESCTFTFASGTKLSLTAVNFPSSTAFFQWGRNTGSAIGCNGSANNQCSFTITQDSQAVANFKDVFTLKVQIGIGDGIVRVKQGTKTLFDCSNRAPQSCSVGVLQGVKYRLEAIAAPGSQLHGFSGQTGNATVCTGSGANFTCEFTITQASSLTANFKPIP